MRPTGYLLAETGAPMISCSLRCEAGGLLRWRTDGRNALATSVCPFAAGCFGNALNWHWNSSHLAKLDAAIAANLKELGYGG